MTSKDYRREVIVDTNILVEFFKIFLNRSSLTKKLQIFLIEFLKNRKIIIIPQVIAEVYTLLFSKLTNKNKDLFKVWLISQFSFLKNLEEIYISLDKILEDDKLKDFGFTDIGLMKIINNRNFLLSQDYNLVSLCRYRKLEAHHLEEILFSQ